MPSSDYLFDPIAGSSRSLATQHQLMPPRASSPPPPPHRGPLLSSTLQSCSHAVGLSCRLGLKYGARSHCIKSDMQSCAKRVNRFVLSDHHIRACGEPVSSVSVSVSLCVCVCVGSFIRIWGPLFCCFTAHQKPVLKTS